MMWRWISEVPSQMRSTRASRQKRASGRSSISVATLLFPGEKPFVRAVATGAGFWLIAWGLFGKLLELPLP